LQAPLSWPPQRILTTDAAQFHLSQLDKQLSQYPQLQQFEQQTNVPKVYVVLGLGALYFFLIFFNIAGEFLVNTAGFVIPAYYSLQALFTSKQSDDTQWLTVSWTAIPTTKMR
jgi:receptor expression-enhancing protein 5/6